MKIIPTPLLLFVFFALFFPHASFAWSEKAHILIAESALQQLSHDQQKKLNDAAKILLRKTPKVYQTLRKRYRKSSDFSYLAVWPDKIRNKKITALFTRYGANVPPELKTLRTRYSSDWHYYNVPYATTFIAKMRLCEIRYPGKLFESLKFIEQYFSRIDTIKGSTSRMNRREDLMARAIMLSFYVHLISDAHQPLHLVSGVDSYCDHDKGGNKVCLKELRSKCGLNLHQYWDRGGYAFEGLKTLNSSQYNTVEKKAVQKNTTNIRISHLKKNVLKEAKNIAPSIYNTNFSAWEKGTYETSGYKEYEENTQKISLIFARKATSRLVDILSRIAL